MKLRVPARSGRASGSATVGRRASTERLTYEDFVRKARFPRRSGLAVLHDVASSRVQLGHDARLSCQVQMVSPSVAIPTLSDGLSGVRLCHPNASESRRSLGRMPPKMNAKLKEVFEVASELPENDRAELAGMLLDTLDGKPDPDVEAAWAEEVERRVRQVDSGEVKMIPWEEVRAELFARTCDDC